MKKTKAIQLLLITATLAGCSNEKKQPEWGDGNKTYVRGDSTAPYARTHHGNGMGLATAALWFYAFRPMGGYRNGTYTRSGYYSNALPTASNIGTNVAKGNIARGGFGRSGARASS